MVKYSNSSVYRNTSQTRTRLDMYVPPVEPDFTRVEKFTVTQRHQHRPDLLAYDLYQNAELFWVFAIYNPDVILDSIGDFREGIELWVPKSISDIGL